MYDGLIFDTDVHNTWASEADVIAYMSREWREFFEATARTGGSKGLIGPQICYSRPGASSDRLDVIPEVGGPGGSHYPTLARDLLERHGIDRALLTYHGGMCAGYPVPRAATEICRASNDWLAEHWLAHDERLYGTIMTATHAPHDAAKEIRRMAAHPRMAGVLIVVNPLHKPFGHPVYEPIFEAAAEVGLPLVTHVAGDTGNQGTAYAAGWPTTRADNFGLLDQPQMHNLASLLVSGVFDRYPGLKILFNESGIGWVPGLLWELDARRDVLRLESPGLQRLPSEYFRDHVWVSTQPFDSPARPKQVIDLLETFGGLEDKLCFSSDYPHYDSEGPAQVAARLPEHWRPKVFAENTARLFGWPLEPVRGYERVAAASG